jgi:pimeloyl-ACP methyl ester carboxylesterase
LRVEHPRGSLFTRIWTSDAAAADTRSPIVLFHDSLGCVDLWRDFPERLSAATGRCVVAYDRLGFGRSDARSDRPSLNFVAEEAQTYFPVIRQQVGFDGFIALGHSVGGGMAIHCAADFSRVCEALITESAQVFLEDRTLQGIAAAKVNFRNDEQILRLGKYHGSRAEWVLDAWFGTWLDPQFASWSLASVLPRVGCPVLAIHGAFDEYGSARHPEMITQLCSGPSRMALMDDAHHVPHREHPERVINIVSDFINQTEQAASRRIQTNANFSGPP